MLAVVQGAAALHQVPRRAAGGEVFVRERSGGGHEVAASATFTPRRASTKRAFHASKSS
jgi:hypothetical protein